MADNFDKVVKALLENNKSQEETTDSVNKLNKTMTEHFTYLKRQVKDQEEETTENKKTKRQAGSSNKEGIKDALGLGKRGLVGMLLPLTAGIAALSASMSGLRGWELGAIKKIKGMATLPRVLNNGLLKIRNVSLGMFGLTAEGLITKDAKGRFAKALPLTTQISNRMNSLRTSALNMFGLGADGKLLAVSDGKGKFKLNVVGRITRAVSTMLSPLVNVAAGVTEFAASKAGAFLKTITAFGGNFAKLFGKILWPIGFLVSLFDGVKSYQESDADGLIGKLGDGVGGFLGSLIGAPFDLLKKGISWVIKKLFGVEVNDDGSIPEGQGMAGWIVKQLESFSFEKTIKKITSGIFGVVEGAINWVKLLFSDPTDALGELFSGLLKTLGFAGKGLLDILWYPVNTIINWIGQKFDWIADDAPKFNLADEIGEWVTAFGKWFGSFLPDIGLIARDMTAKLLSFLPDWMVKSMIKMSGGDPNLFTVKDGAISKRAEPLKVTPKNPFAGLDSTGFKGIGTSNYVVDTSTNSGDSISIVKVAPPTIPSMSAVDQRMLNQQYIRAFGFY